MGHGCVSRVTCDLHYETDWSFVLKKTLACADVATTDVCFATYACVCNNGYYRITADMPEVPKNYDGVIDPAILAKFNAKISGIETALDLSLG